MYCVSSSLDENVLLFWHDKLYSYAQEKKYQVDRYQIQFRMKKNYKVDSNHKPTYRICQLKDFSPQLSTLSSRHDCQIKCCACFYEMTSQFWNLTTLNLIINLNFSRLNPSRSRYSENSFLLSFQILLLNFIGEN